MQAITYDVTRDEWDPNDNTPSATRTSEDIRGFELHHTGGTGPRSLTFQDKADWLLGIERYHELSKKWSDIFYNLFVFGDGEIWEGRRSDRSSQSSVAQYLTVHVPGNNSAITEPQYQSLLRVARLITTDPGLIRGHSDRAATECPGDTGRAALARIQKEIRPMSLFDLPPVELVPENLGTNSEYLAAVKRTFIGAADPGRVASRSVVGIVATRVDDDSRERDKAVRLMVSATARDLAATESALSQRITAIEERVAGLYATSAPMDLPAILNAVRADIASLFD